MSPSLDAIMSKHPPPKEAASVQIGRFLPIDVPDLAIAVAEEWAASRGLPSYAGFLTRHDAPTMTKPIKPTADMLDDIMRRSPPPVKSEQERKFFRHALEQRQMAQYFNTLRTYEREQSEHESFCTSYPPNEQGYIRFLCAEHGAESSFFFDRYRTLPIPIWARKLHTYIVAGSGSGKSELIKQLIFQDLYHNKNCAMVLIEPHGELSNQIARWREFVDNRRLVYIRPGYSDDVCPVFNPFDISDEDRQSPRVLSILVDDTMDIVTEILGREFTINMQTLFRACVTILYHRPGSTFRDIIRFVDPDKNADLIEFGKTVLSPDHTLYEFITRDLNSDTLKQTRMAVRMRFMNLLSRHTLRSFLLGKKTTIHLDKLIEDKSIIIFNLAKGEVGKQESAIIGKFIIAHLKAYGLRRGRGKENLNSLVPAFVYVDECQQFITQSMGEILEELRKFGIHLTLVQQYIGQGKDMDSDLEESILTNTGVKIIGRSSAKDFATFRQQSGVRPEVFEQLQVGKGKFCVHYSGRKPFLVQVPGHRVKNRGAMKKALWDITLADQISRFYTAPVALSPDEVYEPSAASESGSKGNRITAPTAPPVLPIEL